MHSAVLGMFAKALATHIKARACPGSRRSITASTLHLYNPTGVFFAYWDNVILKLDIGCDSTCMGRLNSDGDVAAITY